jgi:predicted RNA-binding Zn ribbon-like protein
MRTDAPSADRPRAWPVRPAVGFLHPLEVLKDQDLDVGDKREILAAWASDASAVEHRPSQRWLLGTPAPVPLSEVLSALRRLDRETFS